MIRAGAPPAMVQILGRWASDVFKTYTRYHKNLMPGVAAAMARSSDLNSGCGSPKSDDSADGWDARRKRSKL